MWNSCRLGRCLVFVLLTLVLAAPASAQPATFLSLDDFVRDWTISKQFTIAVAQKMPAESYSFKATPEEMSFGELMIHITASLFAAFDRISGEAPPSSYIEPPIVITKEIAIDWINQSFDYVIRLLPRLTNKQLEGTKFPVRFEGRPSPEINGREMIMNMLVHVAHHRGQCEVYLRLKGITPPIYTF